MGLYCLDKKYYIVNANEVNLPNITVSYLVNFCVSNVHSLNTKYFEFKLMKYIYSPTKRCFLPIKFSFNCSLDLLKRKFLTGLNELEVEYQRKIYGANKMEVQVKSYFYLFYKEIKDPFYIFQFFSVIMWMFSNYIKYGIVIIITTFIFLSIAIYEIRSNLLDMQKLAVYNCEVLIHRSINSTKKVVKCMSEDLIPGDLFELPADGKMMPCDAILLSGSVIMNESVLTGESTPIFKTHIPSSNSVFDKQRDGKYILFSGTKIIQKRSLKDTKVFGLVLNTGFYTEKGSLIRSILYPKDSKFKFQSDSWKYIIFMGFIAVIGFFITLKYMISYGLSASQIVFKGLDLLTTAVPPALPACIGIGISIALARLKKYGIKCINRKRVNVAGGINLICFDKTGTLTEDHLQILGYRPIHFNRGDFIFDSFYKDCKTMIDDSYQFKKNSSNQYTSFSTNIFNNNLKICSNNKEDKIKSLRLLFVECLTTCHAITRVNDVLMGDPIDVEMFTATGWILKENSENSENYDPLIKTYVRHHLEKDTKELIEEMSSKIEQNGGEFYDVEEELLKSQYELGIIRRFDFSSKLQRMSVIVKNVNEDFFKIYCKGSPEKIRELCREETIPDNFHSILSDYTNKGLRVLGLSCKLIKMDFITSQKMSRESAENNMIFLGFIIVQNKLKKNTTSSIEILHNAGLKLIMATGDNLLTAVSVAQDCKLVNREIPVYECEANATNGTEYNLEFKLINGKPITDENDNLSEKIIAEDFREDYQSLNDASLEIFQPKRNFEIISRHRSYSKLSHNLNIEVLEVTDESEDEYDIENYDEELKSKIKKMKKIKENLEIDSNRVDVGNLDYTIEVDNYKEEKDYFLAVSGKTFELIYKLKNKFFITRDSQYKNYYDIFRYILRKTLIYARMSPEHKAILIDALKAEKYTVCMCGDGANDISALRAADVGVSLSKSEASIAAHFTSNTPEITCLIKLLREGKASLVTSIQFFKYIMLYSFIQFFSTAILLILGTYMSEYEFLIVDLFLIFPLAILIAR
jgi:cation-transporting ATPase 13A2